MGTFLGLGSPLTAEIVALAGFDWVVVDLEHGAGDERDALGQLQAVARTGLSPLIRVESNERPRFHRALDLGAAGVLVPRLEGAEDARRAVAYSRYSGLRGVAKGNRAWAWGRKDDDYLRAADEENVLAVQIETRSALKDIRQIGAVEGVDVIFLGPADLANALGIRGGPDHPEVLDAAREIVRAATEFGKAAGVVVPELTHAALYHELGFTFLGCGSDTVMVVREAHRTAQELRALRDLPDRP